MDPQTTHVSGPSLWALANEQHGVVTRAQLLRIGFSGAAIKHRVGRGRLHPVRRGVYAVGRPQLDRHGQWMAAVLSCGPRAVLSHESAAALWGVRPRESDVIEVSVPAPRDPRPSRITVHRRRSLRSEDFTRRDGIPVTSLVCTLVDLATRLPADRLEAAVNEADKLDLANPESLRAALDALGSRRGAPLLRRMLDRRTFTLTDSQLERRLQPLLRRAGLPRPKTGAWVNGFKVDFYWPDLRLVVETDGLRYHRTPSQQTRDRLRDQVHAAAGLTVLRFTHAQVAFEPAHVHGTLASVARLLRTTRRTAAQFGCP